MELYHWLALAGGALALLALLLAVVMRKRGAIRVPASVAAALSAFAAGVGVGVVVLASFGYQWDKKENPPTSPDAVAGNDTAALMAGRGFNNPVNRGGGPAALTRGMPGGGRGGRGGRGGGGPSPKTQLTSLVDKLDVLTSKPLAVEMKGDKKTKVLEQLRGLGEKDELSDDEAKQKLDALLKVLEPDRATLEAAGYRWPGAGAPGGGGRGAAPPNPFKQEDNGKHLKDLQERLEKGAAG
jgi:hypothetical protein